jgi:hypothetical protein
MGPAVFPELPPLQEPKSKAPSAIAPATTRTGIAMAPDRLVKFFIMVSSEVASS